MSAPGGTDGRQNVRRAGEGKNDQVSSVERSERGWVSRSHWLATVEAAYVLRYPEVRDQFKRHTGSGVSLEAVRAVAQVMADAADHDSGRRSRLSVDTLCERTGLHQRVVGRARTLLEMLELASEVQRGRLLTRAERVSRCRTVWGRARFGSQRGWASVWHLHEDRAATTG